MDLGLIRLIRAIVISLFLLLCFPQPDLQAMPPVQRTVLSNRLVLLHSEDHTLPFVTLQFLVDAGSQRDPSGREGLAYLTAKGLLLGTSSHDLSAINEELDFLGASLDLSSGRDYAIVSLRILKKDLDKGVALLMEVLTKPLFPDKEIKQEIEKTLAALQSQEDQPGKVAEKEFLKTLYLSGPYRNPSIGTKESLPELTRDMINNFHRTYYRPNNCILAVVGDITSDELKTKLVPLLNKLPAGDIPEVPVENVFIKGPATVKIDRGITQANIILGNAGISRDNPDFYTLTVMNYILGGGGFASRLLKEIRDKRGLAYSVASFFDPGKYPGTFQIVLQTKNSSAREAVNLALGQMKLMQKELISETELKGAKQYLIGSFPASD